MNDTKTNDKNLPAMQSGGRVAAIVPSNFAEVVQIAGAIVRADMAPPTYKGNVEKATVAILAGMEVGFTPFAALQSIAVINNTPAIFGDGLVALVRASGFLEDLQEGLEVNDKGEPQVAWCKVKRKGEASWKERTLTLAECHRAGWTRKQGPWQATPGRMMTIRVRTWLLRDMFADVLRGLHSAEELQDMVDITPAAAATVPAEPKKADYVEPPKTEPTEKPAGKRGAKAKTTETVPDAPPKSDDPPPPEPGVTDVVDENEAPPTDGDDTPINAEPITFQNYTRTGDFFAFADAWIVEESRTEAELVAFRAFYNDYMNERLDPKFKSAAVRDAMLDTERVWKECVQIASGKTAG